MPPDLFQKIILKNYKNQTWNLSDDFPSSRELFLLEAIKIKKIKNFSTIVFDKYKKFYQRGRKILV